MKFLLISLFCLITTVLGLPTVQISKSISASAGSDLSSDGPITFNDGNVGVKVTGFHASAGLVGGPHAAAGGAGTGAVAGVGAGAGASAGASAYAGASASAGIETDKEISYGHRTYNQKAEVVSERTVTEEPKVVREQTVQGAAQVQRTVIEKTVIPQYVEKTIQVPSYVEKTIRVPTVVEHKVRVPVTPKVVENTYEENAGAHAYAGASASFNKNKAVLVERPSAVVHKEYNTNGNYGGNTGFHASGYAYKSGGLLGNILNIPIATLGAVGNLFNGGAQGSFAFNKQYSSTAY